MTPEEGRAALARAHANMTPEEIAAHALALASVVASLDGLAGTLALHLVDARATAVEIAGRYRDLQITIRTIASLNAAGRRREAKQLAADLAALPVLDLPAVPALDRYVPVAERWPEVFGSVSGDGANG